MNDSALNESVAKALGWKPDFLCGEWLWTDANEARASLPDFLAPDHLADCVEACQRVFDQSWGMIWKDKVWEVYWWECHENGSTSIYAKQDASLNRAIALAILAKNENSGA